MKRLTITLLLFVFAACIHELPGLAATTHCVTVRVTTATVADIPKLLADAECFEALAATAHTARQRRSYLASAKYRRDKIAALKATIPPPPPVVVPPPPPPISEGLPSLPSVTSNFDVNAELVTTAIPPSGVPDVVGAFRFICNAGQISYDDPIVYPGQPGKSHLHQFFGNTAANANSTYESLRTIGESTCGKINRSAYWIPAMMNGKGKVVRPDYVTIYYKRRPKSDRIVSDVTHPQYMGQARDLPRGMRYVFGYNMLAMANQQPGAFWFNCDGPTAVSGHYPDIVAAAAKCPAGNKLGALINAPDCWNGKDLDSPDHRSHMAYASYGSWGYLKCPATHPYVVPQFTLGAWYTVDADLDRSGTWDGSRPTWHLSSDVMPGMAMRKPGTTLHSDWFGAWDDGVLKMWHDACIDKLLNCSGGDLGNGLRMKTWSNFSWTANPRVVDAPPNP